MDLGNLRKELQDYYLKELDGISAEFHSKCTAVLNNCDTDGMSLGGMKIFQYKTIVDICQLKLFDNISFYYATATYGGRKHCSDTARWLYNKNERLFWKQGDELNRLRNAQVDEMFYLICGPYNDTYDHFPFNYRPILENGLKGVYDKAKSLLDDADEKEKDFLNAVCNSMLELKRLSERFANLAYKKASESDSEAKRLHYKRIAESAQHTPWEKPRTFFEALNTLLFMKEAIEAIEGVGCNSFGRMDVDLYPFYCHDIENGVLTEDEAYNLICEFMLCGDLRYGHDSKMVWYSEHELENTICIGGCDEDGNPICNEITLMIVRAARENKCIYPKLKCRFSDKSPEEYLEEISQAAIEGNSTMTYQNDNSSISALHRAGRTIKEARDYITSGCWDIGCCGLEKLDSGNYLNLLRTFELSVHNRTDIMEKVGMNFKSLDGAESFEEVYKRTIDNFRVLIEERIRITREGGRIWNKVDMLPIFSSTLNDALANKKDYTSNGARYHDEKLVCFGLPNIVDSLMAIKTLCFEEKKYILNEFLKTVRSNWENNEIARIDAIRCHGYGDGSAEANAIAERINADVFNIAENIKEGTYGGKVLIGYCTYTEIKWWGERTKATPDGRKDGDYFAHGLTPSRLKKIPSVTTVIETLAAMDGSKMAGDNVVNLMLSGNKMTKELSAAFLRSVAQSAVQSLQMNFVSREQLLDAQKHPEKYPDLVVRVTGFSAKFTSLSPEWQEEVLSRNYYQ